MREIFELFPTPVVWCTGLVKPNLVRQLHEKFSNNFAQDNHHSQQLQHSLLMAQGADPGLDALIEVVKPEIAHLGELLFGEALDWNIKEAWFNFMEKGGQQAVHNHANSFISGVVYLTESHPSAHTRFIKSLGGRDFVFSNSNARSTVGAFSADKWVSPAPSPGDVVLFPSFLLHEVPTNQGESRSTLAFNAVPALLDAWGYKLHFS